jgi:hypothetical protein
MKRGRGEVGGDDAAEEGGVCLYNLQYTTHGIGAHGCGVMRAVVKEVSQGYVAGGDESA